MTLRSRLRDAVRRLGFDLVPFPAPDLKRDFLETYEAVRPYTMTSIERVSSLCEAVRYVVRSRIPGEIVECGVWRGGSMMAAARTLLALGIDDRELFLFDTFDGMTAPTSADRRYDDADAGELLGRARKSAKDSVWCVAGETEVRANLATSGYPMSRVHLVKGRVEETVPAGAPRRIALLRLDTDWYESTRHELEHLYPRLEPGGVLIIDDYGWWQGARRAVDEYFAVLKAPILLQRVDETARLAIVPSRPSSDR